MSDREIMNSKGYGGMYNQPSIENKDKFVESVVEKYQERSRVGIQKYNTTLERKDLNTVDWLNHLQEELMDATLYIERLKEEVSKLKDIL